MFPPTFPDILEETSVSKRYICALYNMKDVNLEETSVSKRT